jgi:hypothetical protein
MSLYNSFDRSNHLSELADPLETQGSGVLTPALRRRAVLNNIMGNSNMDGTVLVPSFTGAAVSDKLLRVPTVASGGVLAVHVTDAMTHSIRIRSDAGTLYYLMATTTVANRTGGG